MERPYPPSEWSPQTHPLMFQQIDVEESMDERMDDMPDPDNRRVPVIRLFGITADGVSVLAHIHGFLPYFYVEAPPHFSELDTKPLCTRINRALKSYEEIVHNVELVERANIYGYHHGPLLPFIKITLTTPRMVSRVKQVLQNGLYFPSGEFVRSAPFESNLAYTLRFMIDAGVTGINWVEIAAGEYRNRQSDERVSTCRIEVDVPFSALISHPADTERYSTIAPLRVLSFDIECAGRKGIFPDPAVDPVIQIANMVTRQGEAQPFIRNVFTLGTCAHIAGAEVLQFETEGELLVAWQQFIRTVDPDVVTGYNILNFDFVYLLDRAAALHVASFPYLGRLDKTITEAKPTTFSSKAYGTRESREINLNGRLQLDVLQVMQRDYKLRSYSLNAVSAHFLKEQKEDVHHNEITTLQMGDSNSRRRLATYCLKDAYLPQRLIDKLMIFVNYCEMSRVTGVPFNYLLTRGQQIRVLSQLFREARKLNYVVPALEAAKNGDDGGEVAYEGATVLEPKTGYYALPVATLDFASLYPSIIQAHNLCYTTLLSAERVSALGFVENVDYIKTPSGDYFSTEARAKGVLPLILKNLLAARKRAKNDLKRETDAFKRAVLDGRQLALKVSANSVYGFTGALVGKLPCLEISQSTTSFGREMILTTMQTVEEAYSIKNGHKHDAQVLYGDTDSVMVMFGCDGVPEAMQLGLEAAELVTNKFKKPIALEFEKVFSPFLLLAKKRYAGARYTQPDKWDKLDAKGVESVRRDNCRMVSIVIDTSLRKLIIERDVPGAVQYAKQIIAELLQNKIDISSLVISKALSKTREQYKGKQAHAELAERMRERDAGSAPELGDRVAYIVKKAGKNAKAFEKAEDPIYVLQHNIPIDTNYYLENQLKKPLLRIFGPILANAESELFAGDHTRSIQITAPTSGLLSRFMVARPTCLGCRAVLPVRPSADKNAAAPPVCDSCRGKTFDLFQYQLGVVNEMEMRFARLWTQCQRCQGSTHKEVLCSNADCPIFYMRVKARVDAQKATDTLQRFTDATAW